MLFKTFIQKSPSFSETNAYLPGVNPGAQENLALNFSLQSSKIPPDVPKFLLSLPTVSISTQQIRQKIIDRNLVPCALYQLHLDSSCFLLLLQARSQAWIVPIDICRIIIYLYFRKATYKFIKQQGSVPKN